LANGGAEAGGEERHNQVRSPVKITWCGTRKKKRADLGRVGGGLGLSAAPTKKKKKEKKKKKKKKKKKNQKKRNGEGHPLGREHSFCAEKPSPLLQKLNKVEN